MPERSLWAEWGWIDGAWQQAVLLEIDAHGCWSHVTAGVATPPPHARRLPGPVLPGLVDAHSHAFQRAFVGLSERRASESDDFWSWRERMYRVALRITPAQMRAVATQLYVELLRGGYTQVCEFHYLHHDLSGQAYADPATMCWALADAAQHSGIGLTLLPVLYQRAGFSRPELQADQRRFAGTPEMVMELARMVRSRGQRTLQSGVAIHSLRAADLASIQALLEQVGDESMPIHIHIAEQTGEVDDCLKTTGRRPIQYLCDTLAPDARWQLVHATHATPHEIDAVARAGAGIVICPATEANLGDGLSDLAGWLNAGVPMAIGSDSQVVRSWAEELRWLEYGQRLLHRKRNVAAAPGRQDATAARLFDAALTAGAAAAGAPRWGLVAGARADALVIDTRAAGQLGIMPSHRLDALVFAGGEPALREVLVAGAVVLRDGRHPGQDAIGDAFVQAMQELWNDTSQ
ncbi:MAG: formimidoylglutamate deiminase [Burkholderiaceae bacterium]